VNFVVANILIIVAMIIDSQSDRPTSAKVINQDDEFFPVCSCLVVLGTRDLTVY
jgi:hypothetical protein